MTLGRDWASDLRAAFKEGHHLEALFIEYKMRAAADQEQQRFTPIPRGAARFLAAYEANDREALAPWLNDEGNLTSEATQLLLDAWAREDAQSR